MGDPEDLWTRIGNENTVGDFLCPGVWALMVIGISLPFNLYWFVDSANPDFFIGALIGTVVFDAVIILSVKMTFDALRYSDEVFYDPATEELVVKIPWWRRKREIRRPAAESSFYVWTVGKGFNVDIGGGDRKYRLVTGVPDTRLRKIADVLVESGLEHLAEPLFETLAKEVDPEITS